MTDSGTMATRRRRTRTGADDALPIHLVIQRDIENKVMTGEWPPGFRIPPEHELVKVYDCSRMTVNKALSSLAASGLINRKRRRGSFVTLPRIEEPLLTIQDMRAEVLSTDRTYSFEILYRVNRTINDVTDANHIGVPLKTRMLYLDLMHYADGLPFALEMRQINLDLVPEAANQSFDEEPPGTWLLDQVPWTSGEHSLRAISADDLLARQLSITPGTACISIARRTWRGPDLITFVRLIYPGERHRFVVKFGPGTIGAPGLESR